MGVTVDPVLANTVTTTFQGQLEKVYEILDQNLENMEDFTSQLENQMASFDIPMSDLNFAVPALNVDGFNFTPPPVPAVNTAFDVTFPGEPVLQAIPVDTIAMPSHDITPPVLADRADPNIEDIQFTAQLPAINTDVQLPTKPDLLDLTPPEALSLVFPEPPDLSIPDWEGVIPEDTTGDLTVSYNYSEPVYDDGLMRKIRAWVEGIIENGGTGLGEEVLAALRANFKSWIDEDLEEEYQKILNFEASRGFTIPTGALNARLRTFWNRRGRKVQEYDNQLLAEEAKLAQQNTQFAVQYGAECEKILREAHNQLANRSLQLAKDMVASAIEIYNAKRDGYLAALEAVKIRATVYETRIRSLSLVLEQYKTEIEAKKLTLEAKAQEVQIYTAMQGANAQLIDMWAKEADAFRFILENERNKLELFKGQIEAYTAQIAGQKNKIDLHTALLASDESKTKVYSEQMRGYGILAEAVNSQNQVAIEQAKLQHEVLNRGQIELHNAALTRADAILKAAVTAEGFKLQAYETESKGFESQAGAYESFTDAQTKAYTAQVQYAAAMVDKGIKQAEINQTAMIQTFSAKLETLKARIQTWSQTVASCLSTINNSLQLGYTGHISGSVSENWDWQGNPRVTESHEFCEKACE
jgi:hypothetical protein